MCIITRVTTTAAAATAGTASTWGSKIAENTRSTVSAQFNSVYELAEHQRF
jgi:hypothetical protein